MNQTTRRFEMQGCLGRGGFGEVYLATMVSPGGLRQQVAIKMLRDGLTIRSDAVRRLQDEAKMLAALQHRAILAVYDLVLLSNRVALVAEYIDGEDLDRCIKGDNPLPLRGALEVCSEVGEALDSAYNTPAPGTDEPMRLIHRDIKPGNIRISRSGSVKLLDFGIAVAPSMEREARTGTGLIIGTTGYLAPERWTEEEVDPPSDVYALGCVLYEAISGHKIFENAKKKQFAGMAVDEQFHDEVVFNALEGLPDAVPTPVKALLRSVLHHDPDKRPTALEFADRCDELVQKLDGPDLKRWCRGRQWPPPSFTSGEWDGRTIEETTLFQTNTGTRHTIRAERRSPNLVMGGLAALGVGGVLLTVGAIGLAILISTLVYTSTRDDAPLDPADPLAADGQEPGDVAGDEVAPEDPSAAGAAGTIDDPTEPEDPTEPGADPVDPAEPVGAAAATASDATPGPSSGAAADPDPAPTAPVVRRPEKKPGKLVFSGSLPFEVRRNGAAQSAGEVPPGTYELWADFGGGFEEVQSFQVASEGRVDVNCSNITFECSITEKPWF